MIRLNEETENDHKVNLIRYAIENKFEINFWYRGIAVSDPRNKKYSRQNWRFAQPVALGYSKASGRLMLRAWQKMGVTNTIAPAWKTFLVDEMKSITVHDGENGKYYRPFNKPDGPNYNNNGDKKMSNIIIKIDLNKPPGENRNKIVEPEKEEEPENVDVPPVDTLINKDKEMVDKIKNNLDNYDEIEESVFDKLLIKLNKIHG